MFFGKKIDIENNFIESQSAFFKAAIYDTFNELELNSFLSEEKTSEAVSEIFNFNLNATERFLNAAASFNIIKKTPDKKFVKSLESVRYSAESSVLLFSLLRCKIPDLLNEKTPISFSEVSKQAEIDINHLLDASAKHGFIKKNHEEGYSNYSQLEKYLLSSSDKYIGHKITHYERVMFPMFSKKGLLGALKTGRSQWVEIFGEDVATPFDIYKKNPDLLEDFTHGLHHLNADDDQILAGMLHLDSHIVLDVGGGSGAWALQLLKNSSKETMIDIYELPEAIPLLKKILAKYSNNNEKRIRYIPGSFIANPSSCHLEGISEKQLYDIITLGWILHDWKDETNLILLRKVKSHLKPDGKLIILETHLPENKVGSASILDLAMLLQTEGRERTFEEYKKLLKLAGFINVSHELTPTRRQMIIAGRGNEL